MKEYNYKTLFETCAQLCITNYTFWYIDEWFYR